jgi:hypothetical protein
MGAMVEEWTRDFREIMDAWDNALLYGTGKCTSAD